MIPKLKWPSKLKGAAEILSEADAYTECLQCSPWDFAVEITEFKQTGVSRADLRYLVLLGLVEHAKELPAEGNLTRHFRSTGKLTFCRRSCFVLTESGRLAVEDMLGNKGNQAIEQYKANGVFVAERCNGKSLPRNGVKPHWDRIHHKLVFGDVLVKQYRAPALNQHLILCAFQEEDWPERIDDPLTRVDGIEPKRRLHEAIAGLNRNQVNAVLHFSGDGQGLGIRWVEVIDKTTT